MRESILVSRSAQSLELFSAIQQDLRYMGEEGRNIVSKSSHLCVVIIGGEVLEQQR